MCAMQAQDRDFMEAIAAREKDEVTKASARRERARADAHWMQQVLEQQMQLERQREAELDILFKCVYCSHTRTFSSSYILSRVSEAFDF